NPFFTCQLARGDERLAIGHLDDLVDDVPRESARPEVLADTLHLVRRDRAAVDRAVGIRADDAYRRILLFQIFARAADRPAGADAGDEVGDAPFGLTPDLGSGGAVVRLGISRVEILIGLKRAG